MIHQEIPENYKVQKATINRVAIESYHSAQYLHIEFKFTSNSGQHYPAYKLVNIEEGISYFNSVMNTIDMEGSKDKEVIVVSTDSDICMFLNPENNKMFSIPVYFHPEIYKNSLEKIIEETKNTYLSKMDLRDAIFIATLSRANKDNNYQDLIDQIISTHTLSNVLVRELPHKETKSIDKKSKI